MFFDFNRFVRFRVRWFDLPMILWCMCPSVASLSNGFGGVEPISTMLLQFSMWLLPYLIGRLYFSDANASFAGTDHGG